MSISKETILQDKYATNVIQSLSDNPNESGLDAENLKIAFDAGATHIKNYIHDDLIDDINSEIATVSTSIGNTNTTIGQLENLTTTNKSNVVSAINEVNYDSGWIDITSSRGTWNYLRCRKSGKKVLLEGNGTIKFDPNNKFIGTIPSGYRIPGTQTKYIISAVQGSRLARIFVAADGHETNPNKIGIDWIKRIDTANDDTSDSFWIDFRIEYYVD